MLPTEPPVLLKRLLELYKRACDFNRRTDDRAVELGILQFYQGLGLRPPVVRKCSSLKEYAREAWAAREAREAWEARAAREAWEVWDLSWASVTYLGAVQTKDLVTATKWSPVFACFLAGAWVFLPMDGLCLWMPLPQVRAASGRLHSDTGPAFALGEDRLWFWKGVEVPQYVIENPRAITLADIESEPNVEIRRIKTERFGLQRFLEQSGALLEHRDDFGMLYRKVIPGDEDLVMVKVVNSTPEPDGSFKDYFLRVPPAMRTARQAVAWTFGKQEGEYAPEVET